MCHFLQNIVFSMLIFANFGLGNCFFVVQFCIVKQDIKLYKTMKKKIILVAFLSILGTIASETKATAQGGNLQVASETKGVSLLTKGDLSAFENYMEQNANKFVNKKEYSNLLKVLTSYNQSVTSLKSITEQEKINFQKSVTKLNKSLSKVKGSEDWLNKVNVTAKTINFLWNFDTTVSIKLEDVQVLNEAVDVTSL